MNEGRGDGLERTIRCRALDGSQNLIVSKFTTTLVTKKYGGFNKLEVILTSLGLQDNKTGLGSFEKTIALGRR